MEKRIPSVGVVWLVWLMVAPLSSSAESQEVGDSEPHDWPIVISRLQQQLNRMPGHGPTRKQLATAHNNYAVSLADHAQYELAIRHFEEAIRLDATQTQFQKNLATVYLHRAKDAFEANRFEETRAQLQEALSFDASNAHVYALLGELEYQHQRLKEARAAWKRAVELDPEFTEVQERLQQLERELPVESDFERLSQAYFDLRYEERLERTTGFDIRDALLEARRAIGADFSYWPKRKFVVLVYSAERFRVIRQDVPDWVAGQYDGKIRVPLPGAHIDLVNVKRVLWHEYTHALIHELTQGQCPVWFNEGLAEYEGSQQTPPTFDLLRLAVRQQRLIPWRELSDHFSTALPPSQVGLAYEESHSIVRYFIERYGWWRIRRLLKALAEGHAIETVLETEFHMKLSRLTSNWYEWLTKELSARSP